MKILNRGSKTPLSELSITGFELYQNGKLIEKFESQSKVDKKFFDTLKNSKGKINLELFIIGEVPCFFDEKQCSKEINDIQKQYTELLEKSKNKYSFERERKIERLKNRLEILRSDLKFQEEKFLKFEGVK